MAFGNEGGGDDDSNGMNGSSDKDCVFSVDCENGSVGGEEALEDNGDKTAATLCFFMV